MNDLNYLLQALALAQQPRGQCAPNPAVGAIITTETGEILAEGYHTGPGNPHAEIEALNKASQTKNTTLYVTLEPCCHQGRTPPCTDAIIKAGIKRVVYGCQDPNPIVAGKGIQQLIQHNIICDFISLPQINAFYESYTHWTKTRTPFITAKIAITLDGKIAGKNGERIQITDQPLNEFTHCHRKSADAILTTAKTIINDDPQLNARYQNNIIAKNIYILDAELTIPATAKIFATAKSVTLFHSEAASKNQSMPPSVCLLPVQKKSQGLDLQQIIQQIGADGVHDLWIEAGGKCFASFWQQQLLQRALIYLSPKWLGQGLAAFDTPIDFSKAQSISYHQIGNECVLDLLPLSPPLAKSMQEEGRIR
jgi:diaminohydroxyphosphoribosylaminopyrimidine deaminase/5-amino-6-(5-phosphoribosylamino)uracil reductase